MKRHPEKLNADEKQKAEVQHIYNVYVGLPPGSKESDEQALKERKEASATAAAAEKKKHKPA